MHILAMCMDTGWSPFPGSVTEWSDGDLFLAMAAWELRRDAEREVLEKQKQEMAEKQAEQARNSLPKGSKSGGGGAPARTSAHPIQMTQEGEE